jgi:hypothetical protein
MKTVQNHATVRTAFGQELDKEIKFTYEAEIYEKFEEIPADKLPDNEAILSLVNQRVVAAARAAKTSELLTEAGITKPTLEDPKVQFATMVKTLIASGRGREEADALAKQLLGSN